MSKEPKRNVYVGHRYVPKIMGEWDKQETYEGLSIVTHQGTSYTSKKRVPVGVDILNEEYWVVTGNYNAQVEHYRQEVRDMGDYVDGEVNDLKNYVNGEVNDLINYVNNEVENKANQVDLDETNQQLAHIGQYVDAQRKIDVSIESFGASVDKEDNTNEIQNALDFVGLTGGTVRVPYGVFKITSPIYIPPNTSFIGVGKESSIIKQVTASTNAIYAENSPNVYIAHIGVDGVTVDGVEKSNGIIVTGSSHGSVVEHCKVTNFENSGIAIRYDLTNFVSPEDCKVISCYVDGVTYGHGIMVMRAKNTLVTNNTVTNVEIKAVRVVGSQKTIVTNNTLKNSRNGVSLEGFGDRTNISNIFTTDFLVSNNYIEDNLREQVIVSNSARYGLITDNIIRGYKGSDQVGVRISVSSIYDNSNVNNIEILNNDIKGFMFGVRIFTQSEESNLTAEMITIKNNKINDFSRGGIQVNGGNLYVRNIIVENNTIISEDGLYGIGVVSTYDGYIKVMFNTIIVSEGIEGVNINNNNSYNVETMIGDIETNKILELQ